MYYPLDHIMKCLGYFFVVLLTFSVIPTIGLIESYELNYEDIPETIVLETNWVNAVLTGYSFNITTLDNLTLRIVFIHDDFEEFETIENAGFYQFSNKNSGFNLEIIYQDQPNKLAGWYELTSEPVTTGSVILNFSFILTMLFIIIVRRIFNPRSLRIQIMSCLQD